MATLLIIDDRPANREFMVTLLAYGGHRLLEAADGAEGIEIALAERPDLVIADILMPTMDGYEFVRRLRADPAVAETPVIFLTAHYLEPQARALAAACGVTQILTKPAEPEVVLRAVEAALGGATESIPPPDGPASAREFDREHLRLVTDKLSEKADEVRRTNERLNALVELGLDLGSERDVRRLLQGVCDGARRILGARYAAVGVLDPDGLQLRHYVTSGVQSAASGSGAFDPRGGILGQILTERRCFRRVVSGADAGSGAITAPFASAGSFLGAPIVSPARIHGWLCLIEKLGADEFTDEDERLAGILAAQVGRIYENGSLYAELLRHTSELDERVRQASLLTEIGAALTQGLPLRRTLELCAEALVTHLDAAFARIWTLSEAQDTLELQASAGLYTHTDGAHSRVPIGQLKIGLIAQERTPHLSNDVYSDPRVSDPGWARREGMVAFAGYPLLVEDRLVGVVAMFAREPLSDATLQAIGSVARQIALGVERKRGEAALAEREERIRLLLDSTAEAIYGIDLQGCCTFANPVCARLLGFADPAELVGRNMHDLMHHSRSDGTDYPVDECRIDRAARRGEGVQVDDEVFWRADGTPFAVEYWSFPVRRGDDVIGTVVTFWDVSERRGLEEQLRQAQKMEAIGRLAGGVAHDFNNLLTIISGYSALILARLPEGDRNRESIEQIAAAGGRAAALTRQLLLFSRKAIVEPKVLDLTAVVNDLDKMLRRIIGEDIELSTAADPDLGAVMADPSHVEQVILNLVVNARDAMPQGGRLTIEVRNTELDELYVRDHPDARAGRYVMLAVSDTGSGMDEATIARVWEPFFTTKGDKGTGLGLSTVYGIAKQGRGHAAVYSEIGHGTTVKVYLPRTDTPSPVRREPGRDAMPRGTETVLLVEDEAGVRRLILQVLHDCSRFGHLMLRKWKVRIRMG